MLLEKMSRMPATQQSSAASVNSTRRKRRPRELHPRDHRDSLRRGTTTLVDFLPAMFGV
jgi:hypothetical protein